MRYAHDRRRITETVKYLTPGLSGLRGIVIGPHTKLGVFSLERRVDHVPGDQASWPGWPTSTEY